MWKKGEKQRQTALVDLFCIFTVWLIVPPCHAGFCLRTLHTLFSFWASTPGKHASFCSMQTSDKDNLSDFSKLFHKNAGSILLFPQHFIQTSEQIGGKSIHISNLSEKSNYFPLQAFSPTWTKLQLTRCGGGDVHFHTSVMVGLLQITHDTFSDDIFQHPPCWMAPSPPTLPLPFIHHQHPSPTHINSRFYSCHNGQQRLLPPAFTWLTLWAGAGSDPITVNLL